MVRTPSCDKSGLRKGTWTLEEDMKLIAYVTRYGCWNWSQLPKFAGKKNKFSWQNKLYNEPLILILCRVLGLARCGKSCRLRWLNYLRPNLKRGNFTQEEEDLIIRLHTKLGNRWSVIASNLPGRTDNEIKNHWHTKLKKRLQQKGVTKGEGAKASKSKDNESRPQMDLLQNNGVLQVAPPATSKKSECTSPLSPLSSSNEFSSIASDHNKAAISDENLVLEHDSAFLDTCTEPVIENFWTEPCMAQLFYTANEIVPDQCNHEFQSPDSIQILENDFVFLDTNIETMIENFWSEPYMADMSHIPSEQMNQSEYSSPVNDADLWSRSNLYDQHIRLF